MTRFSRSDGAALLVALMATMLMTVLATALVMTTITETTIVTNYRGGLETLYAADAGLASAIDRLRSIPDWRTVVGDPAVLAFADGSGGGARTLTDGAAINLGDETTAVRRANAPAWRLFGYGPLSSLLAPALPAGASYLVVWIAPAVQAGEVVQLLARAYASQRVQRSVHVVVSREVGPDGAAVVHLTEWGQDP